MRPHQSGRRPGGVNDCLARALELDGVELLCRDGTDGQGRPYGIGRVGTAPQAGCSAAEFATFIKEKLSACSIRFVETGRPVRRVAVGAAPAPPCSPTPWRRGVTLSSLPT